MYTHICRYILSPLISLHSPLNLTPTSPSFLWNFFYLEVISLLFSKVQQGPLKPPWMLSLIPLFLTDFPLL